MKTTEELLMDGVHEVLLGYAEMDYEAAATKISSIEEVVLLSTEDESVRLETRRRIQDLRLLVSVKKRRPLEQCLQEADALLSLGFSAPEHRLNAMALLSRYCLKVGRADVGLKYFVPAIDAMDWASVPAEWQAEVRPSFERLLNQLRSTP